MSDERNRVLHGEWPAGRMSFEDRVLAKLDAIDHRLVKGDERHAETEHAIKDLASAVNRQNGRIGKMEDWRQERTLAIERDIGRIEGKSDTILGKRQIASIGLIAGAAGSVLTVVAAAFAILT